MIALIPVILSIIDNGIKLWDKSRMFSFKKKYYKLIKSLRDAENKQYPEYTDADIDLLKENIETMLMAYNEELAVVVSSRGSE